MLKLAPFPSTPYPPLMTRFVPDDFKKAGASPGTVTYIGRTHDHDVAIDIIEFTPRDYTERRVATFAECLPIKPAPTVTWLRINGLHNTAMIEEIGRYFDIHPLLQEDLANTAVRPKFDDSGDKIAVILKQLVLDEDRFLRTEQRAIVFTKNIVLSFQEKPSGIFGQVKDRIQHTIPRDRFLSTDYLAYALLDALIDDYFLTMERLGEHLEDAQDELVHHPSADHLETIFTLRRELLLFRKAIWPMREVVDFLAHSESGLIHKPTRPYLRDLYDHTVQILDTVETMREMASGLLDIYLSSVNNRMNEIMKVLTIIGVIFLPLSFLAGVYGMNFDRSASPSNMPELGLPYGYIVFWVICALVAVGLLFFFRRKKWI